jgi:heme/copper-type cytochrome/quinol oxidase subunit 3
MKRLAIVLALASGTPGCAHRQLTNQQFAVGAVYAAMLLGLVFLAVRCNDPGSHCER